MALYPAGLGSNVHFWIFPLGMFQSASLDTGLHSDSTANYVNIPIIPLPAKTNREVLYTELDLLEPSSAPISSSYSVLRGNTQ